MVKLPYDELSPSRGNRDITLGLLSPERIRPIGDWLLRDRGGDLRLYEEEILRDDQVAATFQQRRLAVTSMNWEVVAGAEDRASRKAADFLRETLHYVGWDGVTDKMLYGVFYGYAVAECLWMRDGAHIALDALKVRKQRRFGFDGDGRLRLLTMEHPMGELMPERKFWHFSTGADHDDEPYGMGLAHWLYWPVYFKRGGTRTWLIFLDKFGMPTARGTFPKTASDEEKRQLLQALEAIQTDGVIAIPEDMKVELIEAARSGAPGYPEMLRAMNEAVAKVVLSQTLTTENSGGQFKADIQQGVRQEVVRADSDLINDSFNRSVVRWLTEWNFPGAVPPRAVRIDEQPEDLVKRSERDKNLVTMGFSPTPDYIRDTYGEGWEKAASPTPPVVPRAQTAHSFAEDDQSGEVSTPADRYAGQAMEKAGPIIDRLLDPVRAMLRRADSLEAARDRLFGLYPDMNADLLAKLVTGAMLAANLAGRLEVLTEADMTKSVDRADHAEARYGALPFQEAIDFHRGKLSIPTEHWDDLWREQHDVGFMVAGATKAELLEDLRAAVDSSIAEGTTLQQFQKRFDKTVAEHGWEYYGTRAWRTKLIFETNLFSAYQAGRYAQMTDPDVLKARPYWQYKHYNSKKPREQHAAWNGLILPAGDPWWSTHYPPNGFNCRCTVFTLAPRDLRREGLSVSSAPPEDGGVDPGFAYAPGATARQVKGSIEKKLDVLPPELAAPFRAELAEKLGVG